MACCNTTWYLRSRTSTNCRDLIRASSCQRVHHITLGLVYADIYAEYDHDHHHSLAPAFGSWQSDKHTTVWSLLCSRELAQRKRILSYVQRLSERASDSKQRLTKVNKQAPGAFAHSRQSIAALGWRSGAPTSAHRLTTRTHFCANLNQPGSSDLASISCHQLC